VALVEAAVTVMFTPLQAFIVPTVKDADPSQPLLFLAVIVWLPAARLLKVPDVW
jgi:hypothetical protein